MKALIKALFGVVVIALIGVAALVLDAAPGSSAAAEARLKKHVTDALGVSARQWARFEIDGQKVILAGEAPSEAARQALLARVASSDGRGGLIFGGVTAIDDSRLTVAPPEKPQSIAVRPSTIITEAEPEPAEAQQALPSLAERPEPVQEETQSTALETTPEEPDCVDQLQAAVDETNIRFSSARADIDSAGRAQLREIASVFADCSHIRLQITGHTDASGNAARNRQLSDYRADAVKAFLVSVGASADRISAEGMGASEPVADNATLAGRAQNRRIEIELVVDDE